ncbi:MAG: hypothetical protein AVDCRST_MAG21-1118, partial [uncultured Nocardioidaceae bacterium]
VLHRPRDRRAARPPRRRRGDAGLGRRAPAGVRRPLPGLRDAGRTAGDLACPARRPRRRL